MLYLVQINIDPATGTELEGNPEQLQGLLGVWQAKNPVGMYFSLSERAVTIIVDAPNEDDIFEALHKTWVATNSYPTVSPIVPADEFPRIMARIQ